MNTHDPTAGGGTSLTRRTALKMGLVGLIGASLGAGSTAALARIGRSLRPEYRFFTDAEATLLAAVCGQIIPTDDAPGAAETGAVRYIDRQLGGVFARHRQAYRAGLEAFGRAFPSFLAMDAPGKIEALRLVEHGKAPSGSWEGPSQQAFFNLVLAHTMQGFYGSPRHGGNRDFASYRMLGIDYPQVVGRNREGKGSL